MNLKNAQNLVALNRELEQQNKVTNKNIQPLVEKLEYWFGQHPKGFYKHSEPRKDQERTFFEFVNHSIKSAFKL